MHTCLCICDAPLHACPLVSRSRTVHIPTHSSLAEDHKGCPWLFAVVRDFQPYGSTNLNGLDAHPDFNNCTGAETGIVNKTLGSDGKPVYAKTSEFSPPAVATPSRCVYRHVCGPHTYAAVFR